MLKKLKQWSSNLYNALKEASAEVQEEKAWLKQPVATYTDRTVTEKDQFYTKAPKITAEKKKRLVTLIQRSEFRDFEEYIDWRVNASAHKMKAYLVAGEKDKAAGEAFEIDALVKIGQDMQNYWTEVKLMEAEKNILLEDGASAKLKAFGPGSENYFVDSDEAERI